MSEYISVVTTTDSEANAGDIAAAVLRERLAACVQISAPIASRYWWKGAIESATEWRLTIKTRASLFERLSEAIRAIHPYSLPQIVALPIVAGNRDYLTWIEEVTTLP